MKLKRRAIKRGRIEIIPLIDTILILLIFYMSFSTFEAKEKRIDAKMPQVTKKIIDASVVSDNMDLTLHVYDEGRIQVNGVDFSSDTLRDQMKQFSSTPGQTITVVIEAEPAAKYQAVIAALDACAQAELKKVAFRPVASDKPAPTP